MSGEPVRKIDSTTLDSKSSGKKESDGKDYRLSVHTDIFVYCREIGSAIWLYLWCDDRSTCGTENGCGLVFGGMPVSDEDPQRGPCAALGVSPKVIRLWRRLLCGYRRQGKGKDVKWVLSGQPLIRVKRKADGISYAVIGSRKPFRKTIKTPAWAESKLPKRADQNSPIGQFL